MGLSGHISPRHTFPAAQVVEHAPYGNGNHISRGAASREACRESRRRKTLVVRKNPASDTSTEPSKISLPRDSNDAAVHRPPAVQTNPSVDPRPYSQTKKKVLDVLS